MMVVNAVASPGLTTAWYIGTRRRQVVLLSVLAILGSLLSAALVLLFQIVSVAVLLSGFVLVAVAWRPRLGLYLVFGLILLFEAGSADPLMLPGQYLHGGFQSTLGLSGFIMSPLELLLLLICGVWLAQAVAFRRLDLRGGRFLWPMTLFCGALILGLARGTLEGGDLQVAFWEARFLFYMVMCYFLAANMIRRMQHVQALLSIGLIAMGLFAVEAVYRRIALVDTGQLGVVIEFAYSHEVVIFLGALLLLMIAQQIFGAPLWQRLLSMPLLPLTIYALLATERRAGYITVIVGFLAYAVVLLVVHRKAFFLVAVPVLLAGTVYLPLFWNNTSLLGQPARAIRSLSEPDARDAASNEYRRLEKINVSHTIQSDPLLGVGFGRPFHFVVELPDLSWWPFWRYEPHHNILWVWLKTGAIGFIVFWVLMGSAIAWAAHLTQVLANRDARVFATLSLVSIIGSLVFCYVDLGLTSGRVTVFLGIILGTLGVLDKVSEYRTSHLESLAI
jgi:hypothetical protein